MTTAARRARGEGQATETVTMVAVAGTEHERLDAVIERRIERKFSELAEKQRSDWTRHPLVLLFVGAFLAVLGWMAIGFFGLQTGQVRLEEGQVRLAADGERRESKIDALDAKVDTLDAKIDMLLADRGLTLQHD